MSSPPVQGRDAGQHCALSHVLLEATGQGRSALPVELLKEEAGKLLLVRKEVVKAALAKTPASADLVQEEIGDQDLIFLPSLKRAEEGIAARVTFLAAAPPNFPAVDVARLSSGARPRLARSLRQASRPRSARPWPAALSSSRAVLAWARRLW